MFSVVTAKMATPSTIGRMPESCADLRLMGHIRNGFYSVMGKKHLESVYCDFTYQGSNEDKGITTLLLFDFKQSKM